MYFKMLQFEVGYLRNVCFVLKLTFSLLSEVPLVGVTVRLQDKAGEKNATGKPVALSGLARSQSRCFLQTAKGATPAAAISISAGASPPKPS
nr:hypothetical protein [uncultured Cohaesibacter sp.]